MEPILIHNNLINIYNFIRLWIKSKDIFLNATKERDFSSVSPHLFYRNFLNYVQRTNDIPWSYLGLFSFLPRCGVHKIKTEMTVIACQRRNMNHLTFRLMIIKSNIGKLKIMSSFFFKLSWWKYLTF